MKLRRVDAVETVAIVSEREGIAVRETDRPRIGLCCRNRCQRQSDGNGERPSPNAWSPMSQFLSAITLRGATGDRIGANSERPQRFIGIRKSRAEILVAALGAEIARGRQ
jgi:hypothetical protein